MSLQLLSPEDSDIILNQELSQRGFSIISVVYIDDITGNWNDLIGNSTVVTGGFQMRYSKDGKMQASLAGIKKNGTRIIQPGQTVIFSFNYDAIHGEFQYWCSATGEEITAAVPCMDFSNGNPLTLGSTTDALRYFDGILGEVLIYDASISREDRDRIVAELEEKWTGESGDSFAPSKPLNFQAVALSVNEIDLSWEASTDNVAVAGYHVYRHGIRIAELSETSFMDSGLEEGGSYEYFVVAYDEAGNESMPSDTVTISTLTNTGLGNRSRSVSELKVYPNPTTGVVYVSMPETSDTELYFELYAADGSLVRSQILRATTRHTEFSFDLSYLNKGIFLYLFTGKNMYSTGRIVISK